MPATKAAPKPRKAKPKPPADLAAVCKTLQNLQRHRAIILKSRNMQATRLQAIVAGTLGYSSGIPQGERRKKFAEAGALIKRMASGPGEFEGDTLFPIVQTTCVGIKAFNDHKAALEVQMRAAARLLPVSAWVALPGQKGFGLPSLAVVVGEAGDLTIGANGPGSYSGPAKLWRRMGCAPHSFDGKTAMGATWRSKKEGKLPKEEWEAFGYSPRRRSVAYLIGAGLVKQNGAGPYRARWLAAKVKAYTTHPEWDWKECTKCEGKKKACPTCGGTGVRCKRANLHGMLLATKLLLKNLWIEWNDHPAQAKAGKKG